MRDQREKQQAASEQLAGIGRDILVLTRNELYLNMRFLDVALSGFSYVMDLSAEPAATDGFVIYYHPGRIGGLYKENRVDMCRLYLHMVLHCLFRHLIGRDGRDRRLWDLACDIAAESITDSMYIRTVRRGKSWLRQETYRKLREEMKVLTAQKIYGSLERWDLSETWRENFLWTATNTGRRMKTGRESRRSRTVGGTRANGWRPRWRHSQRRPPLRRGICWAR